MKTLQGAKETIFFHVSGLLKAGLAKKNKQCRRLQRVGARSSVVVGLLRKRSGRRGQQRGASLLSDRVTDKYLRAAGNSALKPHQVTNTW